MNSLASKVHEKKIAAAKDLVIKKANKMSVNVDVLLDQENGNITGVLPRIFSDFYQFSGDDLRSNSIIPSFSDKRFYREIRFWKSEKRENYGYHWMQDKCTTRSDYFPMFMEEVYERHDLLTGYFDSHGVAPAPEPNDNVLALVTNHNIILEITGIASIVYTGFTTNNTVGVDAYDFTRHLLSSHPYCNSSTLHELFKILLEWQWAYVELESREPIAEAANSFLNVLGLNISDQSSNEVVDALMSLPDQQLAQFIKTGECNLQENEPECPKEFLIWSKEIMDLINLSFNYKKLLTRSLI